LLNGPLPTQWGKPESEWLMNRRDLNDWLSKELLVECAPSTAFHFEIDGDIVEG
jgi:hypothetical protein